MSCQICGYFHDGLKLLLLFITHSYISGMDYIKRRIEDPSLQFGEVNRSSSSDEDDFFSSLQGSKTQEGTKQLDAYLACSANKPDRPDLEKLIVASTNHGTVFTLVGHMEHTVGYNAALKYKVVDIHSLCHTIINTLVARQSLRHIITKKIIHSFNHKL